MATVLVVDDRAVNRDLVRTVLAARGHLCLEAEDGEHGLAMIIEHRPDLVITDLLMPGIDGYEMVRDLRESETNRHIPVIFYTANYLEREVQPVADALGAASVVAKSGDIAALLKAIDTALDQPPVPLGAPVGEDFSREHLRVLNAKLVEKIRELEDQERLHRLVRAAVTINDDLSLPDTMRRIVTAARSLAGADRATLRVTGADGHPHTVMEHRDDWSEGQAGGCVEVPIRVRGRHFGTLSVTGIDDAPDAQRSVEAVLVELATAAGPAIANAQTYDDAQRRQQWLAASARVTAALLDADPEEALDLVVRGARDVVGAQKAWIMVPEAGALPPAYSTGGDLPQVASLVTIPLPGIKPPGGALVLENGPGGSGLTAVDIEMAETFAGHAALALQCAQAAADYRRLSLLEERDRIASDLHDVVIQRLFALGMRLSSVRSMLPVEHADRVESAVLELDETIDDIRNAIFALRAEAGVGESLRTELLRIVNQAADALGFRPKLRVIGPLETIVPAEAHGDVLATLREGLSNAAKHSGASAVTVEIAVTDETLEMRIADNGRGLGSPDRESGLCNLRRRAEAWGGRMVLSAPVAGTGLVLDWMIPFRTARAELS